MHASCGFPKCRGISESSRIVGLSGILVLEAMVLLLATKFSVITTVLEAMDSFEKAHAVDVDQTIICIRSLFVISSFFMCMYLLTLQSLVALH